jgi:GH24 family phage-related lysozyme (muramidase)
MTFSRLAARLMEIARVADVRPRPKLDTIKRMNENLNQASEGAPVIPEPTAVPELPPVTHPVRKTSKAGIDLMHQFEGCERKRPDGRFEAYLCPAKVWTIGWGSTGIDPFNGGKIGKGTVWTQQQCDMRFEQHLLQFERAVLDGLAGKPASQPQFDAMCSLCYNIGPDAFKRSTLLRMHRAGDYLGAAKQFLRWNKGGGKVLKGLVRRREAEAALYRSGF